VPVQGRRRARGFACGCLSALFMIGVVVAVAGLVILPRLSSLAARALGLEAQGETAAVFDTVQQPTSITLSNVQPVSNASLWLPGYETSGVNALLGQVDLQMGSDDATGQSVLVVTVTEDDLVRLCEQRGPNCGIQDTRVQRPRFDLRPGGAVVYADVTLPELGNVSQTVGAVLALNTSNTFRLAGVDLNGMLYAVPPDMLDGLAGEIERTGNELLAQVALQANGRAYTLDAITITETAATLVLR
jgi:hypothetical protein